MSKKWFYAGVILLLASMGAIEVTSMLRENNTADEAIHLMAGYSYLRDGAFGINAEHPPLGKILCALPALFLNPQLPAGYRDWETREGEPARRFLFENRVRPEVLLTSARAITVALSLLLGLVIALWTRGRFGPVVALLALTLYCFDPTVIAHGRYVTTDLIATLTFFLACIAWNAYIETPSRRRLMLAGAALGMAFASKFSLLILPVVFVALYWAKVRPARWLDLTRSLATALLIALAVVYVAYAGELVVPIHDANTAYYFNKSSEELRADPTVPKTMLLFIDPALTTGRAVQWLIRHVPVPAFSYFKGLYLLYNHNHTGHPAYLLGRHSLFGWWFYFPVAFVLKSPAALVVLVLLTIGAFARRDLWLAIPAIVYLVFSAGSSINIGLRHILPVFPFVFIAIALTVQRTAWLARAAMVLAPLLALETAAAYPHYLAFFNIAAGGPQAAPRYLADSNVDWGQDLQNLRAYMDRAAIPEVCLNYFGSADPAYYKLAHRDIRSFQEAAGCHTAAVSVNRLVSADGSMKPFLGCKPRAKVGYSIYVYDVESCVAQVSAGQHELGTEKAM